MEKIWIDFELLYNNLKISENDSIKPYLVNKLTVEPIQVILPEKFKECNKIKLIIDNIGEPEAIKTTNYQTSFNLNIKAKIPIYITYENENFQDVNQTIKTELLSNNILQKIYNCIIDYNKKRIIIPDDYYLNFFGFYIRVLCFNKKELNEMDYSPNNFELLLELIALFENFKNMESNDKTTNQIFKFIKNLKRFSKKFRWQNEIKNRIKNIKYNL